MGAESAFARRVLGSLSSGIVAIDADGAVVMLNEGARRILGCGPEPRTGRHCREVLSRQPAVARLLLDTLSGRPSLSRAELSLEGMGERRESTIGFTLCPVRDEAEEVCGAAMIFRDLTPFERGDEQERLRERLAALGQMAAGMAHEIRNPLAGMEVVAGLLRRRLAERPDDASLVDELLVEIRRVAGTVTASLDFVRPPALSRTPTDLRELVEDALAVATARVPFRGRIERAFPEELPPLLADGDQLRAVVADVIVNALESMAEEDASEGRLEVAVALHSEDRGTRSVKVSPDGRAALEGARREVVISVSDEGPGVPPELREKVFYPFFTTKQEGSGVGLANAQKVVVSHGGRVELASRPGAGTTIRLCLPVDEPPAFRAERLVGSVGA